MRARATLLLWLLLAASASADVVLDGSFGTTGPIAQVGTDFPITEELGRREGRNLFHSFSELSLASGQSATFSALEQTANVVARVTGGTPSLIAGTLRSIIPGADVWLLNPSGVVFAQTNTTPGAVDVRGSFHTATADELRFADGLAFPTGSTGAPVLSADAPAAFGFLSEAPAALRVEDAAVRVGRGFTLSLVGGDLDISGRAGTDTLRAQGGTLQLVAVAGPGDIPVDVSSFDPASSTAPELGRVLLSDAAFLRVGTPTAGGIGNGAVVARADELTVRGGASLDATNTQAVAGAALAFDFEASGAIELVEGAVLEANSRGAAPGGGIRLAAPRVEIGGGADVLTWALNAGPGGDIELAGSAVRITGFGTFVGTRTDAGGAGGRVRVEAETLEIFDGGELSAVTTGGGRGGDVEVEASSVRVERGGFDPSLIGTRTSSLAAGAGRGGDLRITTDLLEVREGGEVSALTTGAGDAGLLDITAQDRILLRAGVNPLETTGVFARSGCAGAGPRGCESGARPLERTGRGGNVILTSGRLDVEAGAVISARTFGAGDAGNVEIHARDVVRVDGSEGASDSLISVRGDLGDGGSLTIEADRVELLAGGALTSTAVSVGDAGDVEINTRELFASGVHSRTGLASGIYAETTENPGPGTLAGDAGDIVVDATGRVRLEHGAKLSVRTRGSGASGNIDVVAGEAIELSSGSEVAAQTEASGPGGSVRLSAPVIALASGARAVATSAFTGNAGSVLLDARDRVLLESGASVTTEALFADGGNVGIRAGKLVLLRDASISAKVGSGEGAGGNVEIDPDVVGLVRSSITADAFGGPGGNVQIVARGLFASPDSTISASSSFGVQGNVSIQAPDTDLSSGLVSLSAAFVDRESLLRSPCAARAAGTGSFVARGAGALVPPPGGALASEYGPELRAVGAPAPTALEVPPLGDTRTVLRALERCPGEAPGSR